MKFNEENWTRLTLSGIPLIALSAADQVESARVLHEFYRSKGQRLATYNVTMGILGSDLIKDGHAKGSPGTIFEELLKQLEAQKNKIARHHLFVYNSHLLIEKFPALSSHLMALRDVLKEQGSTIWLAGPHVSVPTEISHDVIHVDSPLPDRDQLRAVAERLLQGALESKGIDEIQEVDESDIEAVVGLTEFEAEQIFAMSLKANGDFDASQAWDQKRALISSTKGLEVAKVDDRGFAAIGGCQGAKNYFRGYLDGPYKPSVVVWLDEIEKALSGSAAGAESSGVSSDQLGSLLTWMEEGGVTGSLFTGLPGTAKSAFSKALGAEIDVPVIRFDLGSCKGKYVGESETFLRNAIRVIDGVAAGNVLVVATCNSTQTLPAELMRRFSFGQFYFPLPNPEEREDIWRIQLGNYGFDADFPEVSNTAREMAEATENWTGAEIEVCCKKSRLRQCSLEEASGTIRPVSIKHADLLQGLMREANNAYIDAGTGAIFAMPDSSPGKRQFVPKKRTVVGAEA